MKRRHFTLRQHVRYALERTMSKGTAALIGWLAVASALLVALFSVIVLVGGYGPETADGHKTGALRQLFNNFIHAIDPAAIGHEALGSEVVGWVFLLSMLGITIGGLLIVSSLIGVLATGLEEKMRELRKGRSVVLERGHTLILGWSPNIFTILSELAIAKESERRSAVVVLADRDKVEMEDAIRAKAINMRKTRLVVRTGNPTDPDDLAIVNPQEAVSIIALAEDGNDPDSQVLKTVLAVTQDPQRRPEPYHIVAVIHDTDNLEAAALVGRGECTYIDRRDTIARVVVQAARQPGASLVYTELLDFEGDEIYFREDDSLVGKKYGDALLAYEDASVIGLHHSGSIVLNPASNMSICPGDSVVAIAEDDSTLAVAKPCAGVIDESAIAHAPQLTNKVQHVLLLGWNDQAAAMINEMDKYVRPGSAITVVAEFGDVEETVRERCGEVQNLEIHVKQGNTSSRRILEALDIAKHDQVIVACYSDHLETEQADAKTIITLLHLREIATRTGAEVRIASEMLDDRNRRLAQVANVDDIIVSDQIVSLMVAQISETPRLQAVFDELFQADGSEVYLRPVVGYVRIDAPVSFATIVEAARRRGETAIGYRVSTESRDADRYYGVRVNPRKSESRLFEEDDLVIALAVQ